MDDPLQPSFQRDKFKDVVHFICENSKPEELGNVKLHKILYFADMLHFMSTGTPLTGVEYRKQKFGPTASHLTWALSKLAEEGAIRIDTRDYFGFQKKDYIVQQRVERRLFKNSEIRLLHDVIDFVCSRSAKEISELSHDAAWKAARMGEVMPYYAVFGLIPTELEQEDFDSAIREAQELRPLIDAD
ncbi:MAG: Panacea domain-containing protein [Hyphomicrobiaceae bacterium]